jgi:hypothetical protein
VWAIWYARRKAIHENIFQSLLSTHSDGAILSGFPKVHDSPIQGRISEDHTRGLNQDKSCVPIVLALCTNRVPPRTKYLPVKNTDRGVLGRGISCKE